MDREDADAAHRETVPEAVTKSKDVATRATARGNARYHLGDVIDSSSSVVVYRAHDTDLQRDVAIKVVASDSDGDRRDVIAQARALAQLSQPALIPVFDVIDEGSAVSIVMPLLVGQSPKDWCRARNRGWKEVLTLFVRVGRALAAAQAAGIGPRCFSPSNIRIDEHGGVMVALGVAAISERSQSYLAPEETTNESIDTRADQFSFCLAMWESLQGDLPRRTETHAARLRGVPGWLCAATARGLSPSRDDRWSSIDELLDFLERRRARRSRTILLAPVVLTIGLVAGGYWVLRPDPASACAVPEKKLQGVWDENVRARIASVFESLDPNGAAEAVPSLATAIDNYATAWRAMRVDACGDARIRHTETTDVLDRRMACLDRRLTRLRTLTSTLAAATDAKLVQRGAQLVGSLPRIEDCADRERLMAAVPPPSDPTVRSRIAEIDNELEAITALKWRGEQLEELRRAEAAVANARATGDVSVLARALHSLSKAQLDNGKDDVPTTRELAKVAAAAGLDDLAALAWIDLLYKLTSSQPSFEEARTLEDAVHAAVIRAGSPDELRFKELYFGAIRAGNSGDYRLARERFMAAIPLASDRDLRAELEANLAKVTMVVDGPSAALPAARAALVSYEDIHGPDNALLADPLLFLAQVLHQTGDLAGARAQAMRALELQDRFVARDSGDRAMTLNTLGEIEGELGNTEEAIRHLEEAASIFEEQGDVIRNSFAIDALAQQRISRDGLAKVRSLHQRALAQVEQAMGKEWVYYAHLEVHYADALEKGGECSKTPPLLEHASKIFEKEGPSYVSHVHWVRARCLIAGRRIDAAISELKRADTLCRTGDCEVAADVRWTLGRLLFEENRDRSRGATLVDEARSRWASMGLTSRVAEIDAWRSKH